MENQSRPVRRQLFRVAAAGAFLAGRAAGAEKGRDEEISPAEDLMREHGLLNRALLVYEEALRRLETPGASLEPTVIQNAAQFMRRFVEDYHEKLEERHVFPLFEKARQQTALVQVLRHQHDAGRLVTDHILELANLAVLRDAAGRMRLIALLRQYLRMYRPHEAREDTVLFPLLAKLVSRHEYDALGERFEEEEERQFGAGGFARMTEQVAELERALGLYDLAQFTPR